MQINNILSPSECLSRFDARPVYSSRFRSARSTSTELWGKSCHYSQDGSCCAPLHLSLILQTLVSLALSVLSLFSLFAYIAAQSFSFTCPQSYFASRKEYDSRLLFRFFLCYRGHHNQQQVQTNSILSTVRQKWIPLVRKTNQLPLVLLTQTYSRSRSMTSIILDQIAFVQRLEKHVLANGLVFRLWCTTSWCVVWCGLVASSHRHTALAHSYNLHSSCATRLRSRGSTTCRAQDEWS